MKIVCDSCGAKYSIADEKVAGRVFKIRCKKCGAAIVVKGDAGQAAEAAPAAGAGFDYGGEAVWHTVVEGEQQGPFAPAQLGSMISAGTIGWDAYVWREGFDDWKPAQDIEELVQSIMNPGGAPAAAAEDPFSDQPTMMAGGGGAAKAAPAPKASKRDAGADLFAQSEASPFGGGGDDDDVVASAPSPRVGANQAMTGARNENSVLFSLSNLQALATGAPGGGGSASPSPSKASGPAPKAGMAAGEGSGLIDIRALASATGLTGGGGGGGFGSGPSMGSAPPKLDELISIGAPTGGLGGALGAPVIIAEKPEPARGGGGGMIAAAAIVAVALLGGAGIFAYVQLNQPDPAATGPATAVIAPTTPPPVTAAAPPPTTTVAVVDTAAPPTTGAAPPATTATGGGGGGGHRPPRGGGGGGATTGGTGATATADPPPATRATGGGGGGGGGGDRSIDDLLSSALGPTAHPRTGGGGGGGGAAPAPADSSLPATPGRSDVVSAMTGVRSDVTACGGGQHGLATVAVAVAGGTGRVSSATVSGQFAGTPIGSCVARAVRGATFPHFRNPTFSFNYPFQL